MDGQLPGPTPDPQLSQLVADTRHVTQTILIPLVMALGVIGNSITMLVLTRRQMRSSTNSYLTALAISDTLYLLASFSLSLMHSVTGIRQPRHSVYWSYWPYGLWLADAASNTSTWLTVTFTVERYVAVCHPMQGQIYCTVARARRMVMIVYVSCFLASASTPFEWNINSKLNPSTNATELEPVPSALGNHPTYRLTFYWFTATVFVFLPLLLLAVFNSFLIDAVKRSRRQRQALVSGEYQQQQAQSQQNKITIMLIAVVVIYMTCQMPHACMLVYTAFAAEPAAWTDDYLVQRVLGNIFNFMMAVNCACNFVLYCALSDKYRKTVVSVFQRSCRSASAGQRRTTTQLNHCSYTECTRTSPRGQNATRTSTLKTRPQELVASRWSGRSTRERTLSNAVNNATTTDTGRVDRTSLSRRWYDLTGRKGGDAAGPRTVNEEQVTEL